MSAAAQAGAGAVDGRIVVSGLSKQYRKVRAVDDLSFVVEPGRVTGFLGPNGAGKTTTLRMVLGLVRPTAGSATIGGMRYADLRSPLNVVGAVLEASSAHRGRSGRNHLRIIGANAGVPDARADEVLAMAGLSSAARRAFLGYSLGMRQRLAIATAMIGGLQPAVLATRYAGAVLRRGDRNGREPRYRGPGRRPYADAVDLRPERRLLDGRSVAAHGAGHRGAVRPSTCQCTAQRRDPDSLLNWVKLLIRRYRECPELSWGECTILEHNAPAVFGHRSEYETGSIVTAHNFGVEAAEVKLAVAGSGVGLRAVDLLRDGTTEPTENGSLSLQLEPYASRWLRIVGPDDRYII